MARRLTQPIFTPPEIRLLPPMKIGDVVMCRIHIVGDFSRHYSMMDSTQENGEIRVLEEALHEEWRLLQQQRAVVRRLARELKHRRPENPDG